MALVWKVGALCTMGAICALALRRYVPELSLLLAIVTVGAAIIMLSDLLGEVAGMLHSLEAEADLDESITGPIYRVLIISVLTRIISQICKDAGEGTIAVCSEVAGTFCALWATMPLLRRVLSLIGGLMP